MVSKEFEWETEAVSPMSIVFIKVFSVSSSLHWHNCLLQSLHTLERILKRLEIFTVLSV